MIEDIAAYLALADHLITYLEAIVFGILVIALIYTFIDPPD